MEDNLTKNLKMEEDLKKMEDNTSEKMEDDLKKIKNKSVLDSFQI
jgi:hypothetical protein